ncbi:hypothetical protein Tco_1370943 [Tanacetum coccineum]
MEDHTSDWLRKVSTSGLGQTMNGRTYRCMLCYRLGVPLFFILKPCSACWIFIENMLYRVLVLLVLNIGITLYAIPLSTFVSDQDWVFALDANGMVDFVSGRAVIDVAQHKRVKYEAKCADIGYGFLPFSFSSFGELDKDAVTLPKR